MNILAARKRVEPHVHKTPLRHSETFDRWVGAKVYFKAENTQKVWAFKARGAINSLLSLSEEQRKMGVGTHSSGNHGQALAWAAQKLGIQATVVVPSNAPSVKVEAMKGYGAEVIF